MAFQTFTNFTRLPTEMQIKIWKAAIRPGRPGVQHLEIRILNYPNEDAPDWHTVDIPGSDLFAAAGQTLWTTNPEKSSEPNDWTSDFQRIQRAKSSSYYWDAGMWTACKESRRIILEYAQTVRFAPFILLFQEGRHPDITIRVDIKDDLFIVDNHNFGDYTDEWDELIRTMLYSDLDDLPHGRGDMRYANVAFEFNKSWLVDLTERVFELEDPPYDPHPATAFVHYALGWFRCGQPGQLWLIDRGIKRSEASRRPAPRFHRLNTCYHRILSNEVDNKKKTAFEFLAEVREMANEIEDEGSFDEILPGPQQVKFPNIWVLECRKL